MHHSGTWNASPLAAAAGVAACSLYVDGTPQLQARAIARLFRDGANAVLREKGIGGRFYGRSIVHFYLGACERETFDLDFEAPCRDVAALMDARHMPVVKRLNLHLLQRGVASLGGSLFVFSAVHTDRDVSASVEALSESLDAMLKEGSLPRELMIS